MTKDQATKYTVIDCQVFQTPAWDRGMGKYSLCLIREMVKQKVILPETTRLLFNASLPLPTEVRQIVEEACPGFQIDKVELAVPERGAVVAQKRQNKTALTQSVDELSERADTDFYILSLFLDQACPAFPDNVRKILVFYDLSPLMYFQRYLGVGASEHYLGHFGTVFEADVLLPISETVGNDLAAFLGAEAGRIVSIDGAAIDRSFGEPAALEQLAGQKFVLMPTGGELRKNNKRGVQAFDAFIKAHNLDWKLVLTSTFAEPLVHSLNELCDNLLFVGNVSELELRWLYENCEMMLFPSEYEGLGLPILEAVEVGKKVVCSNIPVFREMSTDAFFYFDHLSVESISAALTRAREGKVYKQRYDKVLDKYRWSRTVEKLVGATNSITDRWSSPSRKIAVVSASPGSSSKVAELVSMLHYSLQNFGTIDYYFDSTDKKRIHPQHLEHVANCYDISAFSAGKYSEYDDVIYHIGNDSSSASVLAAALVLPGRVIDYDNSHDVVYQALADRGYVSEERVAAESALFVDKPSFYSRSKKSTSLTAGSQRPPVAQLPYTIPRSESDGSSVAIVVWGDTAAMASAVALIAAECAEWSVRVRIMVMGATPDDRFTRELSASCSGEVLHNPTRYEVEMHVGSVDYVITVHDDNEFEAGLMEQKASRSGLPSQTVAVDSVTIDSARLLVSDLVLEHVSPAPPKALRGFLEDVLSDTDAKTMKGK